MNRKVARIMGTAILMAATTVGVAATPAQASVSSCQGSGTIGSTYYMVKCKGNPATHPNQYRAWVKCGTSSTKYYGTWEYVDITDPVWSVATCPLHTTVYARGYDVA